MDEGIRFVRSGDQTFYLQGDLKAVKKFRENDTEVQSVCQKILLGSNDLTVPKGVIVTKYEARKFSPQATVSKELLVAPQQSTLFSKIIHLFHRFREFVTGREAKKEERRAAEFRLAQTIFGTEDDALLADLFPSTVQKTRQREVSDIPLSKMLKAWVDAMDSPESPSEKIPALRNLIIYQESLEAIQQISSHRKRAEARTQLNQRIYRDMASHKGPIFVPGGFFDPEKGRVVPIIYELTRDPKGVRAIDVCGESISAMDEPLPQEEPRGIHEDLLKLAGEKQPKKETRTQAGETQIQLQETDSLEDFVNQATLLATGTSAQGAHSSKPSMMGKLLILYAPAIERRLYGVDEWTIEQERISAVTFALECAKGAQKMLTKLKNASESYKTDAHISNFKNNFIICVSNARAALPRALPSTVEGKKMAQEAKKIIETILSEAPDVFGKVSIPKGQSFRAEPSDETQKKHAINPNPGLS